MLATFVRAMKRRLKLLSLKIDVSAFLREKKKKSLKFKLLFTENLNIDPSSAKHIQ